MVDLATELKSVWYLLIAIVSLALWLGRLHSMARQNNDVLKDIKKQLNAAFRDIDQIKEDLPVMRSKLKVLGDMMKPENLEDFHKETATFREATRKDIERLMDAARKAGVF